MYLSIIFDNIQALPFRLWIIEAPFPGNGMPPAAKGLTLMAENVPPPLFGELDLTRLKKSGFLSIMKLWQGWGRDNLTAIVSDPDVLACMDNYHVRLIAPARMSDEEIMEFQSSLREVMLGNKI